MCEKKGGELKHVWCCTCLLSIRLVYCSYHHPCPPVFQCPSAPVPLCPSAPVLHPPTMRARVQIVVCPLVLVLKLQRGRRRRHIPKDSPLGVPLDTPTVVRVIGVAVGETATGSSTHAPRTMRADQAYVNAWTESLCTPIVFDRETIFLSKRINSKAAKCPRT